MLVKQLQMSRPILEERVAKKELVIEGGRYDLDDGSVTILQ
jgi:carbonic anhydrase